MSEQSATVIAGHVTSKDGTPIAYERRGTGPVVILVGGAGAGRPPADRLARITRPTLVATGSASADWAGVKGDVFDPAADAIAASIPHAEQQSLEGQTHMVDPKILAEVLARFFEA